MSPSPAKYSIILAPNQSVGHKEMSYMISCLTNRALVYEAKCGGRGGVAGPELMSTDVPMEPK